MRCISQSRRVSPVSCRTCEVPMEDTKRPIFGAEAERIGTRLDEATDEFLKENGGTGERSELAIQKRVKHDEELGGKIMVKPIFDDETNFS